MERNKTEPPDIVYKPINEPPDGPLFDWVIALRKASDTLDRLSEACEGVLKAFNDHREGMGQKNVHKATEGVPDDLWEQLILLDHLMKEIN